jgi:hypothetical protein
MWRLPAAGMPIRRSSVPPSLSVRRTSLRVCPVCLEPTRDCLCDLDAEDDEMAEGVAQAWRGGGGDDGSDEEET